MSTNSDGMGWADEDLPFWCRGKMAVWDLETTGLDPEKDRITQIAIITISNLGEVEEEWSSYVNPGIPIPPEVTALTGISDETVKDAPPFEELWMEVMLRLSHDILIGYNAAAFDAPFLCAELRRCGQEYLAISCLDPLIIIRDIDRFVKGKGRHRLTETCLRHGVEVEQAHNALGDARMTWRLWERLAEGGHIPYAMGTHRQALEWQARTAKAQNERFEAWLATQPKETP